MGETREPRVSGQVMLDQIRVMEDIAGREALDAARATLPPEHRAEIENILPVSWVDSNITNDFLYALARELGRDPEKLQIEIVRRGVERTLTTLWRILLKFTSDEALVKRTPLLYSKTYDVGELVSRIDTPGRVDAELRGWPTPTVPRLDLIGLAMGIETVLRCAGRKDAQVRFEPRPHGAIFVGTWTP